MEQIEGSINRKLSNHEQNNSIKNSNTSEHKQKHIKGDRNIDAAGTQKNNFFDASSLD